MDAGDYIYIIIAIVLAIINAVANKKKKDAAKRKTAESQPQDLPRDPADILQEILMGKVEPSQDSQSQVPHSDWEYNVEGIDEDAKKDDGVELGKPNQHWSYEAERSEPVSSIEYETPFEGESEEKLYPTLEVKPLDIPDNARFSSIDVPVSIEDSIEEFNYDTLSIAGIEGGAEPDMIFEFEKAMEMEESRINVADEFDAKKAIIYAEIMTPKHF